MISQAAFHRVVSGRFFRLSARVTLAVFALVALLACVGALYQTVGNWRDARRFPQRGKSVTAGPLRLNLDCYGQGHPTVILESGAFVPAAGWLKVQPEVARFTRVCSYDRAGYGWSEPSAEPRTSLHIAKELKALLDAAGETGPYILAGHSDGGFHARLFTSRYPQEVAGLVLLDASHEDQRERTHSRMPVGVGEQYDRDEQRQLHLIPWQARFGIMRLLAWWESTSDTESREWSEELLYLQTQSKHTNAFVSEQDSLPHSKAQVRTAGKLGDRPLIVLTAAKRWESSEDPLLTKEQQEEQYRLWVHELQSEEARLSTRGKQVLVPDSGHMIPFERPDAVVSAIREVWSAAKLAQ